VYVRSPGSTRGAAVITDHGVRFAIGDPDAARVLGLADNAVDAPWPVLGMLPEGPVLSREAALVARDVMSGTP
jgi:hypothetical protein